MFDEVVSTVHLVMKGWEGGDFALDVLGIHFDLRSCSATPTSKMAASVTATSAALLSQCKQRGAVHNFVFIEWLGRVQWLSYSTARLPLCFCPRVMSTIRSICSSQDWHGRSTADQELADEIQRVTTACLTVVCKPAPDLLSA